jgi:hypothetical protein
MIEVEVDRFRIILSDTPFDAYESLNQQAQSEGLRVQQLERREKFIVVYLDGEPRASLSLVNGGLYNPSVARWSDFYAVPWVRDNTINTIPDHSPKLSLMRQAMRYIGNDLIDLYTDYKLIIVSKRADQKLWKRRMKDMNFEYDGENYYLVTQPKNAASSWRRIFYRGDISLLNDVERMSATTYEAMFGEEC